MTGCLGNDGKVEECPVFEKDAWKKKIHTHGGLMVMNPMVQNKTSPYTNTSYGINVPLVNYTTLPWISRETTMDMAFFVDTWKRSCC